MSIRATTWALEADLDPTSKNILYAYADFAGEKGTGAWMFKKTLLTRVRRVHESTIRRRLDLLLTEGWMREGDQNAVPDYVKAMPLESRPIVYDLAMNEETRRSWEANYTPGPRRSVAAAAGAVGGRKSAENRARAKAAAAEPVSHGGGVSVEPPLLFAEDSQFAGGVSLTPPPMPDEGGGVTAVTPPGLHSCDTPGVAQLCNPISTSEDLPNSLDRSEPATQSQNGGPEGRSPSGPLTRARGGSRAKTRRTPQQQATFEEADRIARVWWEYWQRQGVTIVGNRFVGFRQSIVEAALTAGATPEHVKAALRACGVPFPPLTQFQRELAAVQTGRPSAAQGQPSRGGGRPSNVWTDPAATQEERDRVAGLWDGVVINGKRVT